MSYRVSTITCNASIGVCVNLTEVFKHLNINLSTENQNTKTSNYDFRWIEFGKANRGVYHKKRKNENSEKKKCFDNQATVIINMINNDVQYYPNIKIFRNGSVQMTGIRTPTDGEKITEIIATEIKRICVENSTDVIVDYKPEVLEKIKPNDFSIRMINCDFAFPYKVRRKKLHELLISEKYNNACSFQPVDYPGVKLQYYWNQDIKCAYNGRCLCEIQCEGKGNGVSCNQCKKVTVSVFDSGKVLITGANTFVQVNCAFDYINKVVSENEKKLKKTIPTLNEDTTSKIKLKKRKYKLSEPEPKPEPEPEQEPTQEQPIIEKYNKHRPTTEDQIAFRKMFSNLVFNNNELVDLNIYL